MTRYGYARVSSVDQNLSRQVEALIGAGVAYERIYKDKETGSRDGDRKEQKRLFKRMRRGDGHTGGRPRTPEARLDADQPPPRGKALPLQDVYYQYSYFTPCGHLYNVFYTYTANGVLECITCYTDDWEVHRGNCYRGIEDARGLGNQVRPFGEINGTHEDFLHDRSARCRD